MKVVLIRHGKVDFSWKKWSMSKEFDRDCMMYDKAPVIPGVYHIPDLEKARIYISSFDRSRKTALQIFGEKKFIVTELIDEVPLRSSMDSDMKLPLVFWNITGRLQWLFNAQRQKEGKRETIQRAKQFVEMILENGEDCVVVTHGFFMHSLIDVMKKSGFCVEHTRIKYSNGEYIVARR